MATGGQFLIYGLTDPRTGQVRYVGKSTSGLKRPNQHRLPHLLKLHSYKNSWIKGLLKENLTYGVRVLERFSSAESLCEAERRWIAHGKTQGWPLTNLTDGGDGVHGYKMPEEVRRRIAQLQTGKSRAPHTVEARFKISQAHKGRPKSLAMRLKLAESKQGESCPPEVRAKISASRKALFALKPDVVQELKRAYKDEGCTAAELGVRFGRSPQTICAWLRKAGVEVRSARQAAVLRTTCSEDHMVPHEVRL